VEVPLLVVDAFTDRPFSGNQAGVCLLSRDARPSARWMQDVAAEMNHAETAFVHPQADSFSLRWFTPAKEVPLCGHATLASAHALWERGLLPRDEPARFDTKSGRLTCTPGPDGITMDFPTDSPVDRAAPPGLFAALGCNEAPVSEGKALSNLMVVLPDEAAVAALRPDMAALKALSSTWAYIVTAPSRDGRGYVVRYFAPAWGIDEDPATGSIACTLGPYWAQRLGQPVLEARQLSRRGARMSVRPAGDRTAITGKAVTVLSGHLAVPLA
jgi:PhzF family phenazine biosynthesis protein